MLVYQTEYILTMIMTDNCRPNTVYSCDIYANHNSRNLEMGAILKMRTCCESDPVKCYHTKSLFIFKNVRISKFLVSWFLHPAVNEPHTESTCLI